MKRIVIFCALCALWGCRQANTPQTEPIALYYSIAEQSKTDLLTQGDEIGVFSNIEGTEQYFLENVPFVVGADGRSLSTSPAVYYPEAKQAINFYAYLPFGGTWSGGVGTVSVPSDQTTALALKEADLCWATASSTPVATPVALEFRHQMARLLITTNEPTEKIAIPNVFSGGTLDIKTGAFTNTLKSEVFTTGTELILPAQSVARLVLTVAGVDYTFEGSIALETAKTTSISLTLSPTQKTATLAGSSTTDWVASTASGNPTQAVSNVLTMHWPNYLPAGATPDKVVLTINNTDYTVSSGITHNGQSFTVPFASSALRYPYTITKIAFFRGSTSVVPACTQLLGATIYKSAASTVGIKDIPNAVLINGLWWATGNLVADGSNDCKIGAPTDCGILFQFGSLIGWGDGTNGQGTGIGNTTLWGLVVKPTVYTGGTWWGTGGYFTDNTSNTDWNKHFNDFSGGALNSVTGIGDPCSFYLGYPWHTPTAAQIAATFKMKQSFTRQNFVAGSGWSVGVNCWQHTPSGLTLTTQTSCNQQYDGAGYRHFISNTLGVDIYYRTATPCNAGAIRFTDQFIRSSGLDFGTYDGISERQRAYPVRCVAPAD